MDREVVMELGLLTIMMGWDGDQDCDDSDRNEATKYLCQCSLEFNYQHSGVIIIFITLLRCCCNFMIFLGNKLLRLYSNFVFCVQGWAVETYEGKTRMEGKAARRIQQTT